MPEYTVSELSAGAEALDRGRFRAGPGARRGLRVQAGRLGALLFRAEGRRRGARRGVLAHDRDAPRPAPEDGMEVVCTGRLTTYPGRSKYQLIVDSIELAGIGALLRIARRTPPAARRRRSVRGRAQEEAAVSARGDRRRHLADRRGDPRHPASPRRPLSAPGAAVAGRGAGRKRGGAGGGGDRWVQPARARRAQCRGPT